MIRKYAGDVCLTDVFSSGENADSLQFDHAADIHYIVVSGAREAIPAWVRHGSWNKQPAFVVPPACPVHRRTVDGSMYVVLHGRRRKFHPVVRHHQKRMSVAEQVVDRTDSTTHNIAGDVLALIFNNNRTLKT